MIDFPSGNLRKYLENILRDCEQLRYTAHRMADRRGINELPFYLEDMEKYVFALTQTLHDLRFEAERGAKGK